MAVRWVDRVKEGDCVAVWFSCGAASAVAAKELCTRVGDRADVRIMNTPVKEEPDDNRRFLRDCEDWLGRSIEIVTPIGRPDPSAVEVWDEKRCMSFANGYAPCTGEIKKRARQEWELANRFDWIVLGFTAEEKNRYERFRVTERENILPVLIEPGITKKDCWQRLIVDGVKLPDSYGLGFNNANCIGCCKATSPTYWNLVRRVYPDVFEARAVQSRRLGVKLARVEGVRVFLDELSPLAMGKPIESMEGECGIFCEERQLTIFG